MYVSEIFLREVGNTSCILYEKSSERKRFLPELQICSEVTKPTLNLNSVRFYFQQFFGTDRLFLL